MIPTIDVTEELDDLDRAIARFRERRAELGARAGERRAEVSGWSFEEHLYHLCLATDLALRNVLSLSKGKGRLITHEGEPNDLAVQVLTEGSYPRGESVAPRMVQPPEPIDPALLDQELELLAQGVERTRGLLGTLSAAEGRIPHQNLGALSASEWLRFARLHARHHLAIASEFH